MAAGVTLHYVCALRLFFEKMKTTISLIDAVA